MKLLSSSVTTITFRNNSDILRTVERLEYYLQIWYPFLKGLWVLSKQPLLLQKLGIIAVGGGLEQTIVQDISQRFGQGAKHLLLGLPHCGVWVKPQTFLEDRQKLI